VRLRVKDEVLDNVKGTLGRDETEVRGFMDALVAADEAELFEVFSGTRLVGSPADAPQSYV
jgi:hypothetical protein